MAAGFLAGAGISGGLSTA